MIEIQKEEEQKVRCFLVGKPPLKKNPNHSDGLEELSALIDTLGMEIAGKISLVRNEPHPVYGIGSGKAEEIAANAKEVQADCIIFDFELEPTKQRNWEKLTQIPCFDRNEVILRIFAQRAQTKEANLQIELAKLTYSLPRLNHMYGDMARQRGGNYGAKGSGETQLELDRRRIEEKIIQIKKEIAQVVSNRQTQRKQRERTSYPSCALVGYTNAGKSSLLNALTGAEVLVEDKLFATLDPTTRKLSFAEGSSVLLTDTVGFISNLPHTLVEAFRSTLEETMYANLLLVTVDASDEHYMEEFKQVLRVLEEIGAANIPKIILLNKADKILSDSIRVSMLKNDFPDSIFVSAKTKYNFEIVLNRISEQLLGSITNYTIPLEQTSLVELARKNGTILKEEWLEDGIHVTARIPNGSRSQALLLPYKKEAVFALQ